jgi:release factor glutamine methyltransferase
MQLSIKNGDDKAGLSGFTVSSAQTLASMLLKTIAIESALLDAQLLLGHVLQITRIDVQLMSKRTLSLSESADFWALMRRRLCGEPVAYLLGFKEFYGLDFVVSKDVLIPRPDTEVVVEKCLSLLEPSATGLVFDLCTGSGAIGISLAVNRLSLQVIASDISHKALVIAAKNADNLGVKDRCLLRQGDLFGAFLPNERAELIVSNPPYIAHAAIPRLARDVREYEPRGALDAGDERGMAFYERIVRDAPNFLCAEGYLVLEIGFDQEDGIKKLVGPIWQRMEFFRDLAGHTRGVVLQKR